MQYYFRYSAALILLCVLSLLSLFSFSQNNHVCRDLTILVYESPSGIPLPGAEVTIERNDSLKLKKITNEDGLVIICDCTDSNFLLPGYKYLIGVTHQNEEETDEFFYSKIGMSVRIIREIQFYSNEVPKELSVLVFPSFTPVLDSATRSKNFKTPKIDLDIILSDQETGEPKIGEKGYIIRNQTDTVAIVTDINGSVTLTDDSHPGFMISGARYEIVFPQITKIHSGAQDIFHTEDVFVNTRIIRDLKVMHVHQECKFPRLKFSSASHDLDSGAMANADFIYNLLDKHPNMTLIIIGYFNKKDESLAWKRATAVYVYLVTKGIDSNRLSVNIQERPMPIDNEDVFYTDQTSMAYYTDVIIMITSFDFLPDKE